MHTHFVRTGQLLVLILVLTSGGLAQTRIGKFGVGVGGSGYMIQSESPTNSVSFGGGLSLFYSVTEYVGLRVSAGMGQLAGTNNQNKSFTTNLFSGNLYVSGDFLPHSSMNPFLMAGIGYMYFDPQDASKADLAGIPPGVKQDFAFLVGGGVDYFLNEFWSVTLVGEYALTSNDWLDGAHALSGTNSDGYARVGLELRYYFFNQDFITKLLEAQKARRRGR